MRRKLISYDAFDLIKDKSTSAVEYELKEAESPLSRILESGPLSLFCFNTSSVFYETPNGTYVRADYELEDEELLLDNVEEVVVDEDTEVKSRKELISKMVDAVVEKQIDHADDLFDKYMEIFGKSLKFKVRGGRDPKGAADMYADNAKAAAMREDVSLDEKIVPARWHRGKFIPRHSLNVKKSTAAKLAVHKSKSARKRGWRVDKALRKRQSNITRRRNVAAGRVGKGGRTQQQNRSIGRMVSECSVLGENILNYVDFMEYGNISNRIVTESDDKNNIVSIRIPTSKVRNEGKILSAQWKTLKADVKVLREAAFRLAENKDFCKAVAEIKRCNNMSDNEELEEAVGNLVSVWPSVLYLTQEELAAVVKESLEFLDVTNYDDQVCEFIAEGILRTAYDAYSSRVDRVVRLAKEDLKEISDSKDPYLAFQDIAKEFYPALDESMEMEIKVFQDLHKTLKIIQESLDADSEEDDELYGEVVEIIEVIEAVLNGEIKPNLDIAADAAMWLQDFAETNLSMGDWDVSGKAHVTVSGDHPDMAKKARHSYTPASDASGDWGDGSPVSDGKSYKGNSDEMRGKSWGNKGGGDVWPSLSNPYVPKGVSANDATINRTMGGEDNPDDGLCNVGNGDTWPGLQNPYVPKSVVPHVSSDNRVDD